MARLNTNKKLSILITDDDSFFLDGVKEYFRKKSLLKKVYTAKNGLEALQVINTNNIDLILSDINMPEMNGIDLSFKIKQEYPEIKIIILTQFVDRDHLFPLFKAGVNAIIDKLTAKEDIIQAINDVLAGNKFYSTRIKNIIESFIAGKKIPRRTSDLPKLTKREKQLLPYFAKGLSDKKIAKLLENLPEKTVLSPATINTHRRNIYLKFDVHNAAQLADTARKYGMIE